MIATVATNASLRHMRSANAFVSLLLLHAAMCAPDAHMHARRILDDAVLEATEAGSQQSEEPEGGGSQKGSTAAQSAEAKGKAGVSQSTANVGIVGSEVKASATTQGVTGTADSGLGRSEAEVREDEMPQELEGDSTAGKAAASEDEDKLDVAQEEAATSKTSAASAIKKAVDLSDAATLNVDAKSQPRTAKSTLKVRSLASLQV